MRVDSILNQIRNNKQVMYGYITLFVFACLYVASIIYFSVAYENKIYPGVSVYGVDVSGKTKGEAFNILSQQVQENFGDTLNFYGKKEYPIPRENLELDFRLSQNIEKAYLLGRENLYNPFKFYSSDFSEVSYSPEKMSDTLMLISEKEDVPVKDAKISLANDRVIVETDQVGSKTLFGETIISIKQRLQKLDPKTFVLVKKDITPKVKKADVELLKRDIDQIVGRPIQLNLQGERITVNKTEMVSFIKIDQSEGDGSIKIFDEGPSSSIKLLFDRGALDSWSKSFSNGRDKDPQNALLSFSDNKLNISRGSVSGRKIHAEKLKETMFDALENGRAEVEVPIDVVKAEINEETLGSLGIKELVSRGWSDFVGSPTNRLHNVRTGASKFNSVLVKPGEVFSFNKTLGPVEAYTGYLPELVILENKTVPQYGGGLCQVSSTAFRAALNAGFPILERTMHAYPVQYYKPYGVDATIYLPKPDMVFKNDSPGHILIQTHIEGTKLYFDFYGTKKPGSVRFAGNKEGTFGASDVVEGMSPTITEPGARGRGSFTATFYRFVTDGDGKMTTNYWVSKYDTPDKYPH